MVPSPVAVYSRRMLPAEINYTVQDKELLEIMELFMKWSFHIRDRSFFSFSYSILTSFSSRIFTCTPPGPAITRQLGAPRFRRPWLELILEL